MEITVPRCHFYPLTFGLLSNTKMDNAINEVLGQSQIFRVSDDILMNFERHGTGNNTLLCLHGFGASLHTWQDVEPFWVNDFCVYLLDLKGFGSSSKPRDGKYSLQDQAEIVASFIQKQDLAGLTLVGHSYGGAVALATYFLLVDRRLGNRIHSLVLIDSAGYLQKHLPMFVSIPRTPIINRIVLSLIPVRWQVRIALMRQFYEKSKVTDERIERYARFLKLPGSQEVLIESAKQIVPIDPLSVIGRISKIRIPTLIIWGENDHVIPVEHGRRFHREIRDSKLVVMSSCGHVPQEEMASRTANEIRNFCI